MTLQIEKTFPRLWSINSGIVMIVTDLHGDWEIYQGYRDRFIYLHENGEVDGLLFTGDLIHSDSDTKPDKSFQIIEDFLQLRVNYGDNMIFLCGNHELPHIYGFGLGKGKREFTPSFEAALSRSRRRKKIVNLFMSLPFYLRTAAGVMITHAGATPFMTNPQIAAKIFNWNHKTRLATADALLMEMGVEGMRRAYAKLSGVETYDELAKHYLAVTGKDDPRYDDLLRGLFVTMDPDFKYLKSALFTKCENEFGEEAYTEAVEGMLKTLSNKYQPQRFLVAGHMNVQGSYQIIGENHFRLASGSHANPVEAGKYLILDTEKVVENVEDLAECLYSI